MLVDEGLVGEDDAAQALEQQRRSGGYLGEHLVRVGALTPEAFYDALTRSWRENLRDLVAEPPPPLLLVEVDVERTIELGWVACELTPDGDLVVASSVPPSEDLVAEVLEYFPARHVEFVSCTRDDLDRLVLDVRVARQDVAGRPSPHHVHPIHVGLAVVSAGIVVMGALTLPVGALAVPLLVASVLFLVGGLIQALSGYVLLAEPDEAPQDVPDERIDDAALPLYSVILLLGGGAPGLERLLRNFEAVDYPRERTDAILVVDRDDEETIAALRESAPRSWVRVARVPSQDFADVVPACDHALALARGRYVVAFRQDDRPDADQLRRAVATFEADLAARLAEDRPAQPYLGLRVARRGGPSPIGLERIAAADEAVLLNGLSGHGSTDVTEVHCNMRLLRRYGGFAALLPGSAQRGTAERPPRIGTLDSSSQHASIRLNRSWWDQQAEAFARDVLEVAARVHALLRGSNAGPRMFASAIAARLSAIALLLSYPVVLGGTVVVMARSPLAEDTLVNHVVWVSLGGLVLVVGTITVVVGLLLVRQRGWRTAVDALTVPALWMLYSLAAWAAVFAAVLRRSEPAGEAG
ncbi:hypothetical protein [Nocardioides sp. J54]|uniref:hypothetical protein n=1 Tax=Nocardioides sp. J54 TaxID=935866 RepID=UPI00048FB51E|nr:hypothetical protein [Nocardioides sp. J54]